MRRTLLPGLVVGLALAGCVRGDVDLTLSAEGTVSGNERPKAKDIMAFLLA